MNDYKIYLINEDEKYAQLEIESIDFSTTFSVSDLTDISKRKDSISKNLKILGTKNNNRVFGNLFNLNRSVTSGSNLYFNYKANKQIDCLIYENNMVVMKGQLNVVDVIKDSQSNIFYDCIVTGYVVKFFNQIADLELSDLNYGTSTHSFDLNTIKNSWSGTDLPYIYPTIDFGVVNHYENNFDFRNFRGGIYLKTYFDAIFKTFNYTYTSNFASSNVFKKAYIPYSEKVFGRNLTETYYSQSEATQTITRAVSGNIRNRYFGKSIRFATPVSSNIIVVKNNVTKDAENETFQSFVFNRAATTAGVVKFNFTATSTFGASFDFEIVPADKNLINYDAPIAYTNRYIFNSGVTSISGNVELQIPFKEYPENSEFAIVMKNLSLTGSVSVKVDNLTLTMGDVNTKTIIENKINDVLTIQNILPDGIKVYQFLTDILKLFNLYITLNPVNDNDFVIEDYDTFYAKALYPKQFAVNWSDKLQNSEHTTSFNLVIPKKYIFKFKEDSSNYWLSEYKKKYNVNFGDAEISNDDGYTDATTIEVQFSPTIVVQTQLDNKIMPNIFTGDPKESKEPYKSNFRILFNNGVSDCKDYIIGIFPPEGATATIYSQSNTTYNISSPILKDSNGNDVFNMAFGVPKEVFAPVNQSIFTLPNLYTEYYQNQLIELIDPNFLTLQSDFWLNENDISNLDFQQPIYINTQDIGDGYFKLLEVNYKSSLELSKVKLQKIII